MLDERIINFLQNAGPVFFVTPTVDRAIGLEDLLPDFHIVCTQLSDGNELLRERGVKIFVSSSAGKNSGKILSDRAVIDYIRDKSAGKKANIITFKPSPMIEKICEREGFRYLGNRAELNRIWEDKVKFAEITSSLGLKNADSRVLKIEADTARDLPGSSDFSDGRRYVVQFPYGYSGNSTHIAGSKEELAGILEDNIGRKAKIADFIEGDTYTLDVCIGPFGLLMSQPIFQITGFTELNRNPLGTCGNDYAFGKKLDDRYRTDIAGSVAKIADKMAGEGYSGVLGFDFVIGEEGAHIIEVNPRLVGSIPAITKLQLGAGEIPFLLLQMLSFMDFDFSSFGKLGTRQDFDFSQLIFRNTRDVPVRIGKTLVSGIYSYRDGDLEFVRSAYCAEAGMKEDEFFLNAVPAGAVIDQDMEYADMQLPRGIMETRKSFEPDISELKDMIIKNIILDEE